MMLFCLFSCITMHGWADSWIDTSEDNWSYGSMYQWRVHMAFSHVSNVAVMKEKAYALSNSSLFAVDKQSQEIEYYNRLNGLNGSMIDHISYNAEVDALLLTYQNGQLDVIDSNGDVHNIPDLYLKQMSYQKNVNHIYMHEQYAYLSMNFGIIVVDMKKYEVKDTYMLGSDGAGAHTYGTTIRTDSIYAISTKTMFVAALANNLMDYTSWQSYPLPPGNSNIDFCSHNDHLYLLRDSLLWKRHIDQWQQCAIPFPVSGIRETGDQLLIFPKDLPGVAVEGTDYTLLLEEYGVVYDMDNSHASSWMCTSLYGLFNASTQRSFYPHGPIDNHAYRMRFVGDKLYVLPGGRWATQNKRAGCIMYLENNRWTNISNYALNQALGVRPLDLMNVAQDPKDSSHYFVTSYGFGLLEMNGEEVIQLHMPDNSPLLSAVSDKPMGYTRTDAAMYDDQGYLWVLNTQCDKNIHVISPDQKWSSFNIRINEQQLEIVTPGEIMVDNRNPQWKWIPLCRYNTGLILLQDNGTPTNSSDDRSYYRDTWYDQNGAQIKPSEIHSMAQDLDGVIWVGTNEGLFLIPASVDFATSDRCERVIIPRNDGTKLADYLLDKEKITAIVVDGANRKWIGTASSGVFLLSEDGQETIHHFTVDNSPLLSNTILSIAIQESTGEVFIGTGDGLMSYMSDAVPAEEDFSTIYAYPNPVHPNYKGYVVIKGLMADTEVRIVDASGNLVKRLEGFGGEVVWDVTNTMGERAASGVYTAICNTSDGKAYGTTKVLVIN